MLVIAKKKKTRMSRAVIIFGSRVSQRFVEGKEMSKRGESGGGKGERYGTRQIEKARERELINLTYRRLELRNFPGCRLFC